MNRQPIDSDQLLRDIRNDLRFLSYRAGRPLPFLWKYILCSLLLVFGLTFIAELAVTFLGPLAGPRHQAIQHQLKEVQP